MLEVAVGGGAAAVVGASAWAIQRKRARMLARERLAEPFVQLEEERVVQKSTIGNRRWWLAPLVGACLWTLLGPMLGVALPFAISLALVATILVAIVEEQRAHKAKLDLEAQLSEAIDLIVGSLGAGGSTLDSIDNAGREVRQPLGGMLEGIVGRLRLGDIPRTVFEDFAVSVPLESFRLFAFTILVHEESGGSLAPILSSVGRTIRDRLDLSRRVRSEATQSMASVVGILAITYAIAIVTWRVDPDRMELFLADPTGARLAAGAVFLQAIGLFIMSKMSNIRY